ncbi:MAG: sodium-dependent transporter [Gemmatimonadota bacterium]
MSLERHAQERWATRVGLILAMAGNAVGLGNFLRFPVQAAQNGGGTFMIPYFISFLLLGIPLMWIEWTIGRHGGRFGHGSLPGMFDVLGERKRKALKYLGVLGLIIPLVVLIYYTYVVSWMLGFSFLSIIGDYFGQTELAQMRDYLYSFQNIFDASAHGGWLALLFFLVTLTFLGWVLSRGISGGIEKLALIGMPILFLFAFILMIRVLTLPAVEASPAEGLNFIFNPEWGKLGAPAVWLAAAGQMFFTLSLGAGHVHAYASYLDRRDDVTLTGLSTAATNEFAEVVLGGTIAIVAAVVFFGIGGAVQIAEGGTYDLGIVAMGVVFQGLPGAAVWGQLFGFLWFFLLFVAGITSCVALATPAISFLQEEFAWTRKRAAYGIMALAFLLGLAHVVFYQKGFMDEWDYWAGTFGLVVLAAIEIVLFTRVFGMERGWKEMHEGADLRVPRVYRPIMKWITPLFLFVLLGWWGVTEAVPTLLLSDVDDPASIPYRWISRGIILLLLAGALYLVRRAWSDREAGDPAQARERRIET